MPPVARHGQTGWNERFMRWGDHGLRGSLFPFIGTTMVDTGHSPGPDRGLSFGRRIRNAVEEFNNACLQGIFGANDKQAIVLDQPLQHFRSVPQMIG